jgi:hypothetical protein
MGRARVYTPQVVIDGRRETVGHAESTIRSIIADARQRGVNAGRSLVNLPSCARSSASAGGPASGSTSPSTLPPPTAPVATISP